MISISIATKDGAKYAEPVENAQAGLLDNMINAQIAYGQIAWVEITQVGCKGEIVASGERVIVYRSDLDNEIDEEFNNWVSEPLAF